MTFKMQSFAWLMKHTGSRVLLRPSISRFASDTHREPERVRLLKKYAVIWHIAFGLMLCAGLVLPRMSDGAPILRLLS